jgi:hypothetical protein
MGLPVLLDPNASYCTLTEGIAAFCNLPCGFCGAGFFQGSTYTYLDVGNGEQFFRLAYDASGSLVAVLSYNAQFAPHWSCVGGPPNFDPSDALPPEQVGSNQLLKEMCPPSLPDGAADAIGNPD